MTTYEERAFKALLTREEWSREALRAVIYQEPNERDLPKISMVDVLICKMRRKLKPLGIEIGTLVGKGFFIGAAGRRRTNEIIAAERNREIAKANEVLRGQTAA
ncbi:hypothetical protein IED13_14330 [Bosea sp. SSUT16]|jgi:two-component system cell cycle response regulator CtrA|uniref:OmpR/PhoB-type domain-containing protein n=1 Tax=Bosea spartocytisi TaxID=2773451 RepID=A0A927I035_9HYPH|nr:hypothetical protein [Bosea spartocytisi]MBD3846884.1 hypothetical protein [Bosea spartocytisi]MCT4474327.1 hypothetical protein [Bosea spartocytisi]